MEEPLISIIIPAYNVEKYIKECVESVIHQTYKNLEILLVDDGSTDSSGILCDELAETDDRIRVYHKRNGGLSSARNYALQKATGKYVAFVDADDYVVPEMYEKMMFPFHKHDVDIVACNYFFVYDSGKKKKHDVRFSSDQILSANDALNCFLLENSFRCYAWNKLYKIELFKDITFPDGLLYEDIITSYRLLKVSGGVMYIDNALYAYRQRSDSITHRSNSRVYELLIPIRKICEEEQDDLYILVGVLLYYKYFFRELIKQEKWDESVYQESVEIYKKLRKCLNGYEGVSHRDKVEFKILYSSKWAYILAYKIFSWIKRFVHS